MNKQTLPLADRLLVASRLWAAENDLTLARLGRLVVNDTSFFSRLESPGASTTTATLEKFARFLGDEANWPANEAGVRIVPEVVNAFVHVTGVIIAPAGLSAGKVGESSTRAPTDGVAA